MIDQLLKEVLTLVNDELKRAKEKHGDKFTSTHEGYGVLAEEVFEAGEELQMIEAYKQAVLSAIHLDNDQIGAWLREVERAAINAASECIQVAAVARKMKEGL